MGNSLSAIVSVVSYDRMILAITGFRYVRRLLKSLQNFVDDVKNTRLEEADTGHV
jgi:hypothetical protein